MNVHIVAAPYDSGRLHYRMGAGPDALLQAGLVAALEAAGFGVTTTIMQVPDVVGNGPDGSRSASADAVVEHTVSLADHVGRTVADARAAGRFPIVLAGNCFATVGAVAGLREQSPAVIWLDAHGDLNTPETSTSGFLDGMGAAVMLGWCLTERAARIRGFVPLPVSRFTLAGARDLDPGEIAALDAHQVRQLPVPVLRAGGLPHGVPGEIAAGASETYVHLDLDVLDPADVGPANSFASPDGLSTQRVIDLVAELGATTQLAGLTVSSYDPTADVTGAVRLAAIRIIRDVAQLAAGRHAGATDLTR